MKIKICGLRREEDIIYANRLKPDYVGFIFTDSIRQISPFKAKRLIEKLNKDIKRVGVFVNENIEKVKEIAEICNLDVLQFHGEEKPEYIQNFKQEIWKSFRIKDKNDFNELYNYNVDGYLLDSFVEGIGGGTGKSFDWGAVPPFKSQKFIILAGGLNSKNVALAIEKVKPNVVDVSSGVEVDGYKDFSKMKKFIEEVRR